jgi:outer membrane protein OmpA-like peptidoglycan-associated protein
MRKITPFLLAASLIGGVLALTTTPVNAASGDVTSTAFTAPASVSGQTLKTAFADSTGGSYQIFQSGQTLTMIRIKQDGSVDSAFGGSGTVLIAVPSQLQSSGALRAVGATNPKTSTWWVSVSGTGQDGPTDTNDVALTSGTLQGTNIINKSVTAATIIAQCASFTAGTIKYQAPSVTVRRNGGAWVSAVCMTSADAVASQVFIPLTSSGDPDASAASFGSAVSYGGTGNCGRIATIADPTSVAPAPELWITRTEFTRDKCGLEPAASEIHAVSVLAVSNDGTIVRTQLSTSKLIVNGVRIDPGGRPVFLTKDAGDNSKLFMSRLKTDGSLDTTVGTDGFLSLDTGALPAGANYLTATFAGVVTTEDRVYFVIQLSDSEIELYQNNSTTPRTHGYRMALAAPAVGWAPTYGTGGIGQRHTTVLAENAFSLGRFAATGSTVDSTGRPVNFTFTDSTTSYNVWATIAGATGGGEGGTGLGGFTRDTGGAPSLGSGGGSGSSGSVSGDTRVDKKVYSKLPRTTEVDTALLALTIKQARTRTLTSLTTKTCVIAGRQVALISVGSCVVQVKDKASKRLIRTLRTKVTKKTSQYGTTMIATDPIYFGAGSSVLSAKSMKQVQALVKEANSASSIVVVGHATSLPVKATNFILARQRAARVAALMVQLKVKTPAVVVTKGSTEPASTKKTLKELAKNRRVVVYLIP